MSMRDLPKRFGPITVLPLTREFLKQFVRNHEGCVTPIYIRATMIRWGPFTVENGRDATAASTVGVVLFDRRIQIPVRSHYVAVHANRCTRLPITQREKARAIVETTALEGRHSMQTGMHILIARHFNDAPQFQAEFRWVPGRADVQRLKLLDVAGLRKRR